MNISSGVTVSAITVFIQGLLGFFSPCVLPLLPLYMGYLSGGAGEETALNKRKTAINTFFFVLGISFTFLLIGISMSVIGRFFNSYKSLFAKIGGVIIILFGLYQIGVFGASFFINKERRLPLNLGKMAMSPLVAFLMGFVFSFAWTPCVGPALSSVFIMAASAATRAEGILLIGIYALGFELPFLALGLFTATVLDALKSRKELLKYTVKIGGVLLVIMGLLLLFGQMNGITGYFAGLGGNTEQAQTDNTEKAEEKQTTAAFDFELYDQNGNLHKLSDYKGKTVFLNFWATWCPPCRSEMPDIQKLYEKYGQENVVILGVACPGQDREKNEDGVKTFLRENGYTYPTLMDKTGKSFRDYRITAYPTTYMIDKNGNIYGYVAGALHIEVMEQIIAETIESVE